MSDRIITAREGWPEGFYVEAFEDEDERGSFASFKGPFATIEEAEKALAELVKSE